MSDRAALLADLRDVMHVLDAGKRVKDVLSCAITELSKADTCDAFIAGFDAGYEAGEDQRHKPSPDAAYRDWLSEKAAGGGG